MHIQSDNRKGPSPTSLLRRLDEVDYSLNLIELLVNASHHHGFFERRDWELKNACVWNDSVANMTSNLGVTTVMDQHTSITHSGTEGEGKKKTEGERVRVSKLKGNKKQPIN